MEQSQRVSLITTTEESGTGFQEQPSFLALTVGNVDDYCDLIFACCS